MANGLDDDEIERFVTGTELTCGRCQGTLHLTEEVYELRLVQAQAFGGGLELYDVLRDDGDFLFSPYHFEFQCWEEIDEALREHFEDAPPVEHSLGILDCDVCGSAVCAWEILALVRPGELHCSPRSPEGPAVSFEAQGKDQHLCIGCLQILDEQEGLWDGELRPTPERPACSEGIASRCW